jgi:hypothetical protein
VSEAINKTIPSVKPEHSTFHHWFSKFLMYYINKKTVFKKYKKSKSYCNYSSSSYCCKLTKTNIKADRLKTIADNLMMMKPKHF